MKNCMRSLFLAGLVLFLALPAFAKGGAEADSGKPIKLVGATQLTYDNIFYRTIEKFKNEVLKDYKKPIQIDLFHSGAVGNEKDFFEFMIQGVSVDFAESAPSWAATFSQKVSFLDPPFLYRDTDHWNKVCALRTPFKPIEDELLKKGLRILGYGGGGTRNLILRKPMTSLADAKNIKLRTMASPLQTKLFGAAGFMVQTLDFLEVYNAAKTGVVDGLENESAMLQSMKFYEVAPYIIMTQHAITVRPLWMSEKTYQRLPKDLQEIVLKAGDAATKFHRESEVKEDAAALKEMESKGQIKIVQFPDKVKMQELVQPVLNDYAKELGVEDVMKAIAAVK